MATVTLLQLKSDFWRHQGLHWSGTATGGSASALIDTSLINLTSETFPSPIKGRQIRITSGSASGDLRLIAEIDETEGTLYPHRDFSASVANTNTYELWGNTIDGGTPLTDLFNDVLRRLRPLTHTQVTIVTNQEVYAVTSLVPTFEDIVAVYIRDLDPASLTPYRRFDLNFSAWNDGGAGTPVVRMRIPAQTLDAARRELWVEHHTAFTAFTADTGTVDAVYRDWIVWEAIAYWAGRNVAADPSEAPLWRQLLSNAFDPRIGNLGSLRERFEPRRPVTIRAVEWA